jgi:hypothetical protein
MQGLIRASARLLAMGVVMAAVLALATFAGLGTIAALALGILGAGVVGIVSVTMRRPRKPSAADEIAAIMAPEHARNAAAKAFANPEAATAVDAMAPPEARTAAVDPEANMPRWRRPSLLEARRSDYSRQVPAARTPMRFTDDQVYQFDVRIVRYAVVPLMDRPDELTGARIADLEAGDEVQVLSTQGAFLDIHCPNGERGFVHRTTLRPREVALPAYAATTESYDDALGAMLSRGLPQS